MEKDKIISIMVVLSVIPIESKMFHDIG